MEESQRKTMFDAWKTRHNKEVKKCKCVTPKPRPTDLNNCWDCDGEIYKDFLDKIRW